jgi:hypothetical protein
MGWGPLPPKPLVFDTTLGPEGREEHRGMKIATIKIKDKRFNYT